MWCDRPGPHPLHTDLQQCVGQLPAALQSTNTALLLECLDGVFSAADAQPCVAEYVVHLDDDGSALNPNTTTRESVHGHNSQANQGGGAQWRY